MTKQQLYHLLFKQALKDKKKAGPLLHFILRVYFPRLMAPQVVESLEVGSTLRHSVQAEMFCLISAVLNTLS